MQAYKWPALLVLPLALASCGQKASPSVKQPTSPPAVASSADEMNRVRAAIASRNFGDAATGARSLAAERPKDPDAQLLLARAEALLGNGGAAIHALDVAISDGLANPTTALADPAFDAIRDQDGFAELADRASPSAAAGPQRAAWHPQQRAGDVEIGDHGGRQYVHAGDVSLEGDL